MGKTFSILTVLFICQTGYAQSELKTNQGFLFNPHYAVQLPAADLKERFETFSSIGMAIDHKFKNNFSIGIDYDWYFGNSVKDDGLFSQISGPSGAIIDKNGDFSIVTLNIKGHYGTLNLGYLLNVQKDEPFSGILFSIGGGVMQHKIDLLSSQVTIPQLNDEYEYGYDKMSYGFASRQYVGYQYSTKKNRYRLRGGIEINQGFTQGRRTWNFNSNTSGLEKRFDMTTAIKVGILVPIYTKGKNDEEFFTD